MSGLFKQFKTNSVMEIEGARIEFPEAENDDGTIPTFILARTGKSNKAYSKALEAATRPYRRQIELGTLKNDVAENLFVKVFINNILKGWENVQDEDGKAIPFSKAAAEKLFDEMPDVYERLQFESKESANFRDAALEEEAKN